MTGSIPTKFTYAQNLARIYKKSNIFMIGFLKIWARQGFYRKL